MLISQAYAQAAPAGQGGMDVMTTLGFPALIIVMMYLLVMRPQMKRNKDHRKMLASLAKGDEVVTGGGTLGKVQKVTDNYITVEIAPNVEIVVQKASVTVVLPKGTIKSAT